MKETKADDLKAKANYINIVQARAKAYATADAEAYFAWEKYVKLKKEFENESN